MLALLAAAALQAAPMPADPAPACPSFEVSDMPVAQAAVARTLVREICAVVDSEDFARAVTARETDGWVAGCGGFLYATQRPASADDILANLAALPDFTLAHTEFTRRSTQGVTTIVDRTITVRSSRLAAATTGGIEARAALVSTLAHEMTHLVPAQENAQVFRYTDAGNWSPFCPRDRLVSYGVEDIVVEQWRARQEG